MADQSYGEIGDPRTIAADRVLVGHRDELPAPTEAIDLYTNAMKDGSGSSAARLAVMAALGIGRVKNWDHAFDFLAAGAELGDPQARRQLGLLSGQAGRLAAGEARNPRIWRRVRAELDLNVVLTPPPLQSLSKSPAIAVSRGFATKPVAEWLIKRARGRLETGLVNDSANGELRPHPMRTAMANAFSILQRDVVIAVMQERAARATGVHVHMHEAPSVISYLPGQQFEPHFDFVNPAVTHFANELAILGQRVATCVTYLNDDFIGAETEFPEIGLRFRGDTGDALIFANVGPDGQPDPKTLHAGLPPTKGRKWALSQWLRNKVQPLL